MAMIDDKEGMDNALEYYTDGDNESYWEWFINKMADKWIKVGKEDTEMYRYTNTNVDSAEEMEEEQDYCDWDEYDDYDVEWDEGDYDDA